MSDADGSSRYASLVIGKLQLLIFKNKYKCNSLAGFAKYTTKIANYTTQFLKQEKKGFAKYTTKIAKYRTKNFHDENCKYITKFF